MVAAGIGLGGTLAAITTKEEPAFFVGLIPLLIGAALLVYTYLLAPKE